LLEKLYKTMLKVMYWLFQLCANRCEWTLSARRGEWCRATDSLFPGLFCGFQAKLPSVLSVQLH